MKKKKKLETKKKWEAPVLGTLPFRSTMGGAFNHPSYEDATYS